MENKMSGADTCRRKRTKDLHVNAVWVVGGCGWGGGGGLAEIILARGKKPMHGDVISPRRPRDASDRRSPGKTKAKSGSGCRFKNFSEASLHGRWRWLGGPYSGVMFHLLTHACRQKESCGGLFSGSSYVLKREDNQVHTVRSR